MIKNKKSARFNGFAIALAWPDTFCKQTGSWYDMPVGWLGFRKHHYYRVGHAALILVDDTTGVCQYFDFGRYHAPFQFGRVRSAFTDPGLMINVRAKISIDDNKINNLDEVLTELQNNKECHGEGALYAAYCRINFEKAINKAGRLQDQSPIPYGPFRPEGSNCSRFVQKVILAGQPEWKYRFKLRFFVPFTPTPLSNVYALSHSTVKPKLLLTTPFVPVPIKDKSVLKSTIPMPVRHASIPHGSRWLSGEGAGSWFAIQPVVDAFHISRYSPDGELECSGVFRLMNGNIFDADSSFEIDYLSHCRKVVLRQNGNQIKLIAAEDIG